MSMTVIKQKPNKFQPTAREVNHPFFKETEGGGKKQRKFIRCNFAIFTSIP